jgi:hypothetical protein
VRYRGAFAYIDGQLPDGTTLPLCRLRCSGSAHTWGFAIYRASHDDYEPGILPAGTPQGALDCAAGLYLADPTAWISQLPDSDPRRINGPTTTSCF